MDSEYFIAKQGLNPDEVITYLTEIKGVKNEQIKLEKKETTLAEVLKQFLAEASSDHFDEYDRLIGELYRENQRLKEHLAKKQSFVSPDKLDKLLENFKEPAVKTINRVCANVDHMYFLRDSESRKNAHRRAKSYITAMYHEINSFLKS